MFKDQVKGMSGMRSREDHGLLPLCICPQNVELQLYPETLRENRFPKNTQC